VAEKKRTLPADDKAQKKPRRSGPVQPSPVPPAETTSGQPGNKQALFEAASFPIVGIGASAGGLEALETFFTHVSPDSGMAFVVIQHLDPSHKSMLPDLIRRHTQMQLFSVEDGLVVLTVPQNSIKR
jgi:two-component system CheB/CheR fusion protein